MVLSFNTVPNAPTKIAPYSHSVLCGGFLFVTGQMPINPINNEWILGTIEVQTRAVISNIEIILAYSGMTLSNVVQVRVFLSDFSNYQRFNEEYDKAFSGLSLPARTCVAVSGLAGEAAVEIDVIAHINN